MESAFIRRSRIASRLVSSGRTTATTAVMSALLVGHFLIAPPAANATQPAASVSSATSSLEGRVVVTNRPPGPAPSPQPVTGNIAVTG